MAAAELEDPSKDGCCGLAGQLLVDDCFEQSLKNAVRRIFLQPAGSTGLHPCAQQGVLPGQKGGGMGNIETGQGAPGQGLVCAHRFL